MVTISIVMLMLWKERLAGLDEITVANVSSALCDPGRVLREHEYSVNAVAEFQRFRQ